MYQHRAKRLSVHSFHHHAAALSPACPPPPAAPSTKEDLSFDSWLEQLGELQRGYRELVGRQGAGPQDYWQLLKPWDGVQLFWFVPLRTMWRVQYTRWVGVGWGSGVLVQGW